MTEDQCLAYAQKMHEALVMPKALVLMQQARNNSEEKMPTYVFAHRARQQLQLHEMKAQDILLSKTGFEYEDYLWKLTESKLNESEKFSRIFSDQKEAIRAVINSKAEHEGKSEAEQKSDKKND